MRLLLPSILASLLILTFLGLSPHAASAALAGGWHLNETSGNVGAGLPAAASAAPVTAGPAILGEGRPT